LRRPRPGGTTLVRISSSHANDGLGSISDDASFAREHSRAVQAVELGDASAAEGCRRDASKADTCHGVPEVTFIGALPPPVTGMTAMTQVVVEALERVAIVRRFNWSRGKPIRGWRWRLARVWGAAKALMGLLVSGPARGQKLYYAVSSSAGLYYDLLIIGLARALGYRAVLHHHNYSYINRRDWRVALLDRLISGTGAHAVHCTLMEADFIRTYRSRAKFLFVPPTIVSQGQASAEPRLHGDFTLGFLSTLSLAKGIDDVLATFELLASAGRAVRLVLAGPCHGKAEQALIQAALARWPLRVEYRGPVYGRDKAEFYAALDAFIFPTRNESWGIVLTEAFEVGCPAIARSCGCIPWVVSSDCGLTIDPAENFPQKAVERLNQWIDDSQAYGLARTAAKRRSEELNQEAAQQLPEFVDQLLSLGRE
jgi:glycosyltransferase involved in cell wall biosynthesis